jgi:hypothetical protein
MSGQTRKVRRSVTFSGEVRETRLCHTTGCGWPALEDEVFCAWCRPSWSLQKKEGGDWVVKRMVSQGQAARFITLADQTPGAGVWRAVSPSGRLIETTI